MGLGCAGRGEAGRGRVEQGRAAEIREYVEFVCMAGRETRKRRRGRGWKGGSE